MEEEIEDIASTTDEEIVEDSSEETTLTVEDYKKLEQKNKELYERAKKAEALAKEVKNKPETLKTNETQSSSLSREEAILFAKGYTEDEVDLANKLAKVNGIGILEAIEDDYLKGKRALRLKKEKSEMASLPASNGIGKFKADKPVGEMTEDEHRAYFQKVMGN
jgi:hypothetical protein